VVAGILRIVPYVGTLIATTLRIALSLGVCDGWLRPLPVFLLVAGLELIIANFVEPWVYGAHVGISSLALLVSSVLWAVLWGPAGLILSTPLTVCLVVLGRYVPQLSFLHILLGDEQTRMQFQLIEVTMLLRSSRFRCLTRPRSGSWPTLPGGISGPLHRNAHCKKDLCSNGQKLSRNK